MQFASVANPPAAFNLSRFSYTMLVYCSTRKTRSTTTPDRRASFAAADACKSSSLADPVRRSPCCSKGSGSKASRDDCRSRKYEPWYARSPGAARLVRGRYTPKARSNNCIPPLSPITLAASSEVRAATLSTVSTASMTGAFARSSRIMRRTISSASSDVSRSTFATTCSERLAGSLPALSTEPQKFASKRSPTSRSSVTCSYSYSADTVRAKMASRVLAEHESCMPCPMLSTRSSRMVIATSSSLSK
mmetsp:Transcript_11335/g.30532  ORF Transcript_11335/g.30532 Transcript_11335/m.30532 type:complete len:248 (+) Transcript_11335:1-744(+)